MNKNELRDRLEAERKSIETVQVAVDSADIVARLMSLPEWVSARTVMAYYPIRCEVDLRSLIREGAREKTVLLPVALPGGRMEIRRYTGEAQLRPGRFGIPEPQGPSYEGPIDLIIVPGVGFDEHRHRLGRGGGYYDRFLEAHPEAAVVAVAYDFQVVPSVPVMTHDKPVDVIVTPSRLIR